VVSSDEGTNFHSLSASWHVWTSNGWPPTPRVAFTWPSGATTTSILTLPLTFIRRARSGYVGAVLDLTLRLVSSVEPVCENAEAPARRTTTMAVAANFVHLPVLIDTTPPGIRRCPEVEKARQVPWEGAPRRVLYSR